MLDLDIIYKKILKIKGKIIIMLNDLHGITIIAHRGYWKKDDEKNSKIAFERAFDFGYGVETDLRDVKGEIVISHDMPSGSEMTFDSLLQIMDGRNLPLALNIKADGMSKEIKRLLSKYNHTNYFTFDMSIPEMVVQREEGLRFFTGLSDIVKEPILLKDSSGVWLDSFYDDWFDKTVIQNLLKKGKDVCIVSPDLHHRTFQEVWRKYDDLSNIMICTDFPQEAEGF